MGYGDKRFRNTPCAAPNCDRPAPHLKTVFGRLNWVCEEHIKLATEPQRK